MSRQEMCAADGCSMLGKAVSRPLGIRCPWCGGLTFEASIATQMIRKDRTEVETQRKAGRPRRSRR